MNLADKADLTEQRISNIIEYATYSTYKFIQRGLYELHKPMYRLLLTMKIDLRAGRIEPSEFLTLLRGGGALDINNVRKCPHKWIPVNAWLNLVALSGIPPFDSILDQIVVNGDAWESWYMMEQPENETIPDGYDQVC